MNVTCFLQCLNLIIPSMCLMQVLHVYFCHMFYHDDPISTCVWPRFSPGLIQFLPMFDLYSSHFTHFLSFYSPFVWFWSSLYVCYPCLSIVVTCASCDHSRGLCFMLGRGGCVLHVWPLFPFILCLCGSCHPSSVSFTFISHVCGHVISHVVSAHPRVSSTFSRCPVTWSVTWSLLHPGSCVVRSIKLWLQLESRIQWHKAFWATIKIWGTNQKIWGSVLLFPLWSQCSRLFWKIHKQVGPGQSEQITPIKNKYA